FRATFGARCYEIDAMDPNDLRDCVEGEIKKLIDPKAWQRCEVVNKAELDSLQTVMKNWNGNGATTNKPTTGTNSANNSANKKHPRKGKKTVLALSRQITKLKKMRAATPKKMRAAIAKLKKARAAKRK